MHEKDKNKVSRDLALMMAKISKMMFLVGDSKSVTDFIISLLNGYCIGVSVSLDQDSDFTKKLYTEMCEVLDRNIKEALVKEVSKN